MSVPPPPTSSGFFYVLIILVAGYLFVSNSTLIKGVFVRTNGQRLYLKCAVFGLLFLGIGLVLSKIPVPFSDNTLFAPNTFFMIFSLPRNWDKDIFSAITSIEISLIILILSQITIWISNSIGKPRDLRLYRLLSKQLPITHTSLDARITNKKSAAINNINRHILKIRTFYLAVQLLSHIIAKKIELIALNNNQIDIMIWKSLSLENKNIFIICLENERIFAGFPLSIPDPTHSPDEQTIRFYPLMSGILCDYSHKLHITDVTENIIGSKEDESISVDSFKRWNKSPVALHTAKITYIKEYDFSEFIKSLKSDDACACGRKIYSPKSESPIVSTQTTTNK